MNFHRSRSTGEQTIRFTKQEHGDFARTADALRTLARLREDELERDADNMLADQLERIARDFKPAERAPKTKPLFDDNGESLADAPFEGGVATKTKKK